MNEYYAKIKDFQSKTLQYAAQIFKTYGGELELKLEEYNLLSAENNCIESSTAIGYIMEEFLVTKLITYTRTHDNKNDYKVLRDPGATNSSSFDCYSIIGDPAKSIKCLINIKADRKNNNGVAAWNILSRDYTENPDQVKCYLVLKVLYSTGKGISGTRKILIKGMDSYFLEELDLLNPQQDHRNWSADFNKNSGRLIISKPYRDAHTLAENEIGYENTYQRINTIIVENQEK